MKSTLTIFALVAGLALGSSAASATTGNWTEQVFKPSPAGYTGDWKKQVFQPSPGHKNPILFPEGR